MSSQVWIPSGMEILQLLWATSSSIWLPLQLIFFLRFCGVSCISFCACCPFTGHHWDLSGSVIFIPPCQVFTHIDKILLSLFLSRLGNLDFLNLTSYVGEGYWHLNLASLSSVSLWKVTLKISDNWSLGFWFPRALCSNLTGGFLTFHPSR